MIKAKMTVTKKKHLRNKWKKLAARIAKYTTESLRCHFIQDKPFAVQNLKLLQFLKLIVSCTLLFFKTFPRFLQVKKSLRSEFLISLKM